VAEKRKIVGKERVAEQETCRRRLVDEKGKLVDEKGKVEDSKEER
jgi:hypothetical protein